jgi:hypothetical protein
MTEQKNVNLYEAYASIYAPQEEVGQLDEAREASHDPEGYEEKERKSQSSRQRRMNDPHTGINSPAFQAFMAQQMGGGKKKKKPANEEVETDLFDTILEHLVAEGYADTNQAALAIMANMSEEWRESIVEEILDERNRGEQGMSDREVTRRRNLGGNVRSRVSASSLGDHGSQSAIQKFHKGKAKQRREIHKSGRGTRGDTGESGGQSRYQANKDHSDGYPSITKRGDGPY